MIGALAKPDGYHSLASWEATLDLYRRSGSAGSDAARNYALLDLGGTICTSRKPKCAECPVLSMCRLDWEGWGSREHRSCSHGRYRATTHSKVLSTVSLGPPVTPKTSGDSNFPMSPARAGRTSIESWSDGRSAHPNVGVQLGAHPLRIVAFTHCGLLPVHQTGLELSDRASFGSIR